MRDLPTFLRLWLWGMCLGAACGVASAALFVVVMVANGGSDGESAYQFIVGTAVAGALACYFGGMVGWVLGFATGFVAGLVLTGMLRLLAAEAAAWSTLVVVLLMQVVAGVALASGDETWIWACFVVPAITAIPLALVTFRAAHAVSGPTVGRRDTLAA